MGLEVGFKSADLPADNCRASHAEFACDPVLADNGRTGDRPSDAHFSGIASADALNLRPAQAESFHPVAKQRRRSGFIVIFGLMARAAIPVLNGKQGTGRI